ncbi:hypothetical protein [Halodesulfovibrio sp. MK-HDV]|uniref:hypothetical protein n=1 Tax=Halodesulfovibrio sp. MK-HDV TaxID=2599925 RepID=UPI0013706D22|nr:hypothetical protein [Halodesulfovibrio sp. MK-HDV]KAF1075920.1 hypothetical protein MKHDV_01718 [Halodesulfovibrio sp. MK-HDV]
MEQSVIKQAADIVMEFLGDGIMIPCGLILMIFSVNFMYISASGIKKLDAYFADGKDYKDTWTISANFRFFKYCRQYLFRRLGIPKGGMRLWMRFNVLGYILTGAFLVATISLAFCLKISSWMS